jgi:hypothetical protein
MSNVEGATVAFQGGVYVQRFTACASIQSDHSSSFDL